MNELFGGFSHRRTLSTRETFKKSFKNGFDFTVFDDEATTYYYDKRKIPARPDVRVIACFYYPDAKTKEVYLSSQYFPPDPTEKYWAVVCFYGSKENRRIRGYLEIQDIVKQRVSSKWDAVANTEMADNKPKIQMREVEPGTQIGPQKDDVAWETLFAVEASHLLDKPKKHNPDDINLLRSSTSVKGLAKELNRGSDSDTDEEDAKIGGIKKRSKMKALKWKPDGGSDSDSDSDSSGDSSGDGDGNEVDDSKALALAGSARRGGVDPNINPYPSVDEDEHGPRAGKNRSEWACGERLDVKDDGVWYASTIKAVNEEQNLLFVGYDGYAKNFDHWMPRDSLRLAPLHKFSETARERQKRLSYMSDQSGGFASTDELKMTSFFNVVKKNKGLSSLNAQLENALADAKEHIEEIKRQFGNRGGGNEQHPSMAKMGSASKMGGNDDEKLFEAMQYVMIIDTLKAEVIRLQNSNQKLQADEVLSVSMVEDTLKQALRRRKQRAAMFGESNKNLGLGELDGAFDTDKKRNVLYMIRLLQEDYKRQVLESEFRENQLREYQSALNKVQGDALNLNDKLGEFRHRKATALSSLAQRVGMAGQAPVKPVDESDVLMNKIHQLQVNEVHEMQEMERQIDEYEHSAEQEQLFGEDEKLPSAALEFSDDSSDAPGDGSDSSASDDSDESSEESDFDEELIASRLRADLGIAAPAPFHSTGKKKKSKGGTTANNGDEHKEYDVINPKDPKSIQTQIIKRKANSQSAFELKAKELADKVALLQEQLRHTSAKNRNLEAALYGGNRNPGAFLLSPSLTPGGPNSLLDDIKEGQDMRVDDVVSFLANNQVGVEALGAFLRESGGPEGDADVEFYMAVRGYQELFNRRDPNYKTHALIQRPTGENICKQFVIDGAPQQVQVSKTTQSEILLALQEGDNTPLDDDIFQVAVNEVFARLARTKFRDFSRTPMFQKIKGNRAQLLSAPSQHSRDIEGLLQDYDRYCVQQIDVGKEKPSLATFVSERKGARAVEKWVFKLVEERKGMLNELVTYREHVAVGADGVPGSAVSAVASSGALVGHSRVMSGALGMSLKGSAAATTFSQTSKQNIASLRGCITDIKVELSTCGQDFELLFTSIGKSLGSLNKLLVTTQHNYKQEVAKRIKLFDALQQLKGNIRVFCRVRPLLPSEMANSHQSCVEFLGATQLMVVQNMDSDAYLSSQRKSGKSFTFDRVFGPNVDQARVFADVKGLVASCLDGYNVCIFAYGQTGAGKTFTMQGPEENPGLNARCVKTLFKGIKNLSPQYKFQVHVSMIEIYNERLTDLLDDGPALKARFEAPSADRKAPKLDIRRNARGMYVTNTTHVQVENAEDVMAVVAMGSKNRATFTTAANEHSSRSHMVLLVTVDGIDQVTLNRTYGKLYLVDLAGSERVKHTESKGARLTEAQYINKSLSALGDVMKALSETSNGKEKDKDKSGGHIPYRNSKLTYLLQDALGGNSKTMMFVNVSPSDMHSAESLTSLEFAKRVRKVQLDSHATTQNASLQKYKIKLADMKEQAKVTTEKLKGSLRKVQKAVKERDDVIKALTEKLRQTRRAQADFKRSKSMGRQANFDTSTFDMNSVPQDSWNTDDPEKAPEQNYFD